MPLTNFEAREENAMEQRLWGLMPVVHATALFFYIEESRFRFLIHAIKFRGSVDAVESAMAAAKQAAEGVSGVVASHIITRTEESTEPMLKLNAFDKN